MLKTIVNATPISDFRSFDEVFERMLGVPHKAHASQGLLPIDIVEKDNSLLIKAAVPGVDPEHIDIQVENNVLTIRGELKSDYEETQAKVYRREYSYGKFSRSIRLPEDMEVENISAEFKHGFVTITVPRQPTPTPTPTVLRVPVKTVGETPEPTK